MIQAHGQLKLQTAADAEGCGSVAAVYPAVLGTPRVRRMLGTLARLWQRSDEAVKIFDDIAACELPEDEPASQAIYPLRRTLHEVQCGTGEPPHPPPQTPPPPRAHPCTFLSAGGVKT